MQHRGYSPTAEAGNDRYRELVAPLPMARQPANLVRMPFSPPCNAAQACRKLTHLECLLFRDTTHISRGMNSQDCKCGPTTQLPYYMGASDDPFTEVVRATRFRARTALVSKQLYQVTWGLIARNRLRVPWVNAKQPSDSNFRSPKAAKR
jgi:hypothetical protein